MELDSTSDKQGVVKVCEQEVKRVNDGCIFLSPVPTTKVHALLPAALKRIKLGDLTHDSQ